MKIIKRNGSEETFDAGKIANAAALLFPVLVFMLAFHALSWGLIVSSLTSKYRDLRYLVGFGLQLFMYATPIIYPLSAAGDKFRWALELNPLTPIFEAIEVKFMYNIVYTIF